MDAITEIARLLAAGAALWLLCFAALAGYGWVCWWAAERRRREQEAEDRTATEALLQEAERLIRMAKAEDLT